MSNGWKDLTAGLLLIVIVIPVASGLALRVEDVGNRFIFGEAVHVQHGLQSQVRARAVLVGTGPVDLRLAGAVDFLPRGELVIHEEVVHEEDGVACARVDVGHH